MGICMCLCSCVRISNRIKWPKTRLLFVYLICIVTCFRSVKYHGILNFSMRLNVCARSGLLFVLATRRERINIAQQRYNRHNGMMIAGVCLCLVVCVCIIFTKHSRVTIQRSYTQHIARHNFLCMLFLNLILMRI